MNIFDLVTAKRLGAIVTLAMAIFLSIALLSHNQLDPSFNRACDDVVQNIFGIYGACIADMLLQLFGLASYSIVTIMMFWAVNDLLDRRSNYWLVRLILMILSLCLSAMALAHYLPSKTYSFGIASGVLGSSLVAHLGHLAKFIIILFIPIFLLSIEFNPVYLWKITKLVLMAILGALFKKKSSDIYEFDEVDEFIDEIEVTSEKTKKRSVIKDKKISLFSASKFLIPPVSLLNLVNNKVKKDDVSAAVLTQNSKELIKVLEDFGVYGKIIAVHPGPVVTLYELEPAAGTKSSRVIGLADDIARSISAISSRIAVVPGRNVIGIELPNANREIVYLRELIDSHEYRHAEYRLPIVLGKDIGGRSVIVDLAKMPHLLVAGTTGSGKSVAINTMILSLVYKLTPAQCKFIMIDPKMLELSVYDGIPHLLTPVVTDPKKAVAALNWVVKEMEQRYKLMSQLGVRNIAGYNEKIEAAVAAGEKLERTVQTGFEATTGKPILEKIPLLMEPLSLIVVIVDEMADLMLVAGKDIESLIQRLAQMARAAGIHIIMATQRPSVDVITGVIKANFPTRISFQVISRIDSRTILGEQGGAEQLLGMGDMLYMSSGSKIIRVHGPFVSDSEVEKIVAHLKEQGKPDYIEDITKEDENDGSDSSDSLDGHDDLYKKAVEIVLRDRKISTSYIQRCLKIGYNRAATIVELMEKEGVISPANHVGKREILH